MLITATLLILLVIGLLSLMLGGNFFGQVVSVAVDNTAIVNGSITTYVVEATDVLFFIDTSSLLTAGIALLITLAIVAGITGIQVVGSGLNPESAKIIITLTGFGGLWAVISFLAFNLIISIEIFGSLIYIMLTIGYSIGVVKRISGGS